MINNKLKLKNGFTLVEILLITGFISLATIGIYTAYNKGKIYFDVVEEVRNLDELRRNVIEYSLVQNSYAGISNTVLNNNNVVPQQLRGNLAADIISSFDTPITVTPISSGVHANNGFTIRYTGIALEHCAKFQEMGANNFQRITINGFLSKDPESTTNRLTTSIGTVVNMCAMGNNNSTIEFTAITPGMHSGTVTTGAVSPVVSSVKPIYSSPFPTEAFNTNPHIAEAFKSRHWGVPTSSALPNNTVTITANPLALGYAASGTPISFNVSQRNVDIVSSALNPWFKSVLAANGGNIPASFYQPTFRNDHRWFIDAVAVNTLADLAGAPRGSGLPAAITTEIANFKTFIGPPLF